VAKHDRPEDDVEDKHAANRDRKLAKRTRTMRVSGRSVFTIQQAQQKRDKQKRGTK
jgi:hypothetical protein